ncbi:MAG: hypothetical protein AB7F19_05080 [Candidatus Babeliales bacterium]
MKHLLPILMLISFLFATSNSLKAVERLASGICTHYKPEFKRKPIVDENGNVTGEKVVIDIGNGEEIPAGEDWDSGWLASNDDRITFDYDIKTRRQYRCNQIEQPADKDGLMVECHKRGYDYGMITNGSPECFTTWDYKRDIGGASIQSSTAPDSLKRKRDLETDLPAKKRAVTVGQQ